VFLSRLGGEPIGFTVLGIFVIDRNTVLTVWTFTNHCSIGLHTHLYFSAEAAVDSRKKEIQPIKPKA